MDDDDLVLLTVTDVRVAVPAGSGVEAGLVVLAEGPEPHRELRIHVGRPEARAIHTSWSQAVPPRPSTWDLLVSTISLLDARIDHVVITDVEDRRHYFAELVIQRAEAPGVVRLAARPSDAIALALRGYGAKLFARPDVLDRAGVLPEAPQLQPSEPLAGPDGAAGDEPAGHDVEEEGGPGEPPPARWSLDEAERVAQDAVSELVRAAAQADRLVEAARLRAAAIDAEADERLRRAHTEIEARLAAAAAEAEAYVERARLEAGGMLAVARRPADAQPGPAGPPARRPADAQPGPAGPPARRPAAHPLADPPPVPPAPVPPPEAAPPVPPAPAPGVAPAPAATPDPGPAGRAAFPEVGAGVIRSEADEAALHWREAELDGLLVGLGRRLKRVLQDDHNDLLDGLRRVPGVPTAATVLASPEAQIERFAAAARPFVESAAGAGVRFAAGEDADAVVAAVTGEAVRRLAAAVAGPVRQRVEAVLDERGQDGPAGLVEVLASIYRETRSQRIESLAADVLSAAHAEAVWRAVPEGRALRWVAEDAGGPCPDCDDNVLAGPVPKGQTFPTGQLYPPAHLGCRCLIVPEGFRGRARQPADAEPPAVSFRG